MPVSAGVFSDVAGSLLKLDSQEEEELLNTTSFAKGVGNTGGEHKTGRTEKFDMITMMYANHTAQATLKKEIQDLQEQLQGQFVVRQMLEKAVSQKNCVCDAQSANPFPEQAEELIKEIAVLELEVAYMEKFVLSLYHKTLARQVSEYNDSASATSTNGGNCKVNCSCHILPRQPIESPTEERDLIRSTLIQPESGIHRSQSSLSHRSHSNRIVPPIQPPTKCDDSTYHSLPLSMLERAECLRSNTTSLGDLLLRSALDHDWETPNWISEEMIRSISGIYCELAEPPLMANHYFPYSCSPSLSGQNETWGPNNQLSFSTFNSNVYNSFSIKHSGELGLQTDVVEVRWSSKDRERLKGIEYMLRKYRSLVHRLRQVNPSKMKHEEKLAFWINVHNSLGMHAILVHGNPDSKLKRTASLLKAVYNVGGQAISLDLLRNFILQCKLPRPGQWLQMFFPLRRGTNVKDVLKAYALNSSEHLLPFALSSGSHSDPVVRVYRPENVFTELKAAREAYLHSNICLHKGKILIPKLVQNYAKQAEMGPDDLLRMVQCHTVVPDSSSRVWQSHQKRKPLKCIEWIPHNFDFRYLLSSELA